MLTSLDLKTWHLIHKWTSLVCTLFLLVICVTGLPLIFREGINDWLSDDPPYAVLPADTPRADLDHLIKVSRSRYPGQIVRFVFIDDDEPQVIVTLAPSHESSPEDNHGIKFDARTGQVLKEFPPVDKRPLTFLGLMLHLHADLFAKLPGELFLGVIALLFVISIVSGVVLYGSFMKRLPFGKVRRDRAPRLKRLDLHNLLGIVTLVWAFVVGATGFMNELSTPLFALWRTTELKAIAGSHHDETLISEKALSSVEAAYKTVQAAFPNRILTSVIFPDTKMSSPRHYLIWTKGNTPLTSRLFTPVLVDAQTGRLTTVAYLPWYLRALEVSRPLHFGDYGGLPLKIIWVLLDLMTITVLVTGIYLWLKKRRGSFEQQFREEAGLEDGPAENMSA
jgi:uncharacterized iron-regulated membrane protein